MLLAEQLRKFFEHWANMLVPNCAHMGLARRHYAHVDPVIKVVKTNRMDLSCNFRANRSKRPRLIHNDTCVRFSNRFNHRIYVERAELHFCLKAAGELAKEGIECEVVDGRTIRPLDIDSMVESVRKTNACVIVDQSWSFASIGSEIAAQIHAICFDDLDNRVYRVHSDDVPTPYAHNLEQAYLPNARKICEAVRQATYNV